MRGRWAPAGPNSVRAREWLGGVLLGYGFSVRLAARVFTAIGHYVIGFAIQQRGSRNARAGGAGAVAGVLPLARSGRLPGTTAAADELTSTDSAAWRPPWCPESGLRASGARQWCAL
ncbi:TetR/AcrR family transcriptional regulator C-terminal domain-containing protein [Streptomyces sp. CA-249302]|uniref:TetR/AcrR family transcriptional regulator C-terminal domain-containing protein n=1 Tax=Streptomyces sp. CA-249302 TaxID=3240058 RepID=UPI003D8FBA3F